MTINNFQIKMVKRSIKSVLDAIENMNTDVMDCFPVEAVNSISLALLQRANELANDLESVHDSLPDEQATVETESITNTGPSLIGPGGNTWEDREAWWDYLAH